MNKKINFKDISIKDFFFFDKMMTPVFITIVYWIALVLVGFSALSIIIGSFAIFPYSASAGIIAFFTGIITFVVGFISTRIGFELLCVLFSINNNIRKLAEEKTGVENTNSEKTE
jgi:fatty acid desaturase